MITIEQALEAIDNLDDYARMDAGVDAVGPRELLVSFVSQHEQFLAENERMKTVPTMTVMDIQDDDSLRFIQRVLESNAPETDRQCAIAMIVNIRTRKRAPLQSVN